MKYRLIIDCDDDEDIFGLPTIDELDHIAGVLFGRSLIPIEYSIMVERLCDE